MAWWDALTEPERAAALASSGSVAAAYRAFTLIEAYAEAEAVAQFQAWRAAACYKPPAGVIGPRNYLFAGGDSGSERAAAIYSLIGTDKLNCVDPEAWLRHVPTISPIIPSTGWVISCLGPATRLQSSEITPLPSGVIPSSIKWPLYSRRP